MCWWGERKSSGFFEGPPMPIRPKIGKKNPLTTWLFPHTQRYASGLRSKFHGTMIFQAPKNTWKIVLWGTTVLFFCICKYIVLAHYGIAIPWNFWYQLQFDWRREMRLEEYGSWKVVKREKKGKFEIYKGNHGFSRRRKIKRGDSAGKIYCEDIPSRVTIEKWRWEPPNENKHLWMFFASSKAMDLGIDHPKLVLGT